MENAATGSAFYQEDDFVYRTVSKAAIASFTFAVLGLTAYLIPPFVLLPALGFGFGIVATLNFRKYGDELSGQLIGKIGTILSLVILLSSIGMHSFIYATEVPEGYQRISYGELKPTKRKGMAFSEKAEEFNGKKVFLKGYVRPGAKRRKLKEFILVGDFGDCCFGGDPEITDVVGIRIVKDDTTVDYGLGLRRIGGTFRFYPNPQSTGDDEVPGIYYEIEADHVR